MYLIIFEDGEMIVMNELSNDIIEGFRDGHISLVNMRDITVAYTIEDNGTIHWLSIEEKY